ncbi:MAG: alpha-glucuronidase [Eubacteriales bacterium]|nr:alpha-glucuronidase [Eubacteriales bacterium]MDD3881583.1 alpha-glucuronidase [Eubacteriales bacterium]MDD4512358.1 alpha-glucuronidase [Eubacteriales bacterium]
MNSQFTNAWLPYLPKEAPQAVNAAEAARLELESGLKALSADFTVSVKPSHEGEDYSVTEKDGGYVISGGETGVLYGAHEVLEAAACKRKPDTGDFSPRYPIRMLDHWDNMDGSVERGYAGKSFFFEGNELCYDEKRITFYARMLASAHINAVCINNVNVHSPADMLLTERFLPKLKKLADILRVYGIKLIISIDYAMPVTCGLETADPEDKRVEDWWKKRCDEIYEYIPDFLGFLVKADSEFRPGPFKYGRSHSQGANMLARAIKPHGGKIIWRCFVYNCRQDWRDHSQDRPKAAYDTYTPLDGQFEDNVILQIKNGPVDFQVREPLSPLLFAMPRTRKALELQLAQEYTGQQIDLYFMQELFAEVLGQLPKDSIEAICAVTNLGDDENWCGHDLACANLYAYGKTAFGSQKSPLEMARDFLTLTFGSDCKAIGKLADMMVRSRGIYERYTSPLGLGFMVNTGLHYGPSPEGYEYMKWGTYHRSNHEATGIDRSMTGTGMTAQYPKETGDMYDSVSTCPENLLLFFHRVPYNHIMKDGRTLLQRIYDDHFEGAEEAEKMEADFKALIPELPSGAAQRIEKRFAAQTVNAREWRDVINTYYHRLTLIPDMHGRKIYD